MLNPDAVAVATLAATDVPIHFLSSWGDMLQHDGLNGRHMSGDTGGGTIKITSGPRIAEARSQIVDTFFSDPIFERCSWLLMIDSDMTFEPTLIDQLLAIADPERVPVLGALCFSGGRNHDPYPTIYREVKSEADGTTFVGVEPIRDYPPDTLCKVGATGAACLLVHRQVFVAMSHPWPKGYGTLPDGSKNPYPWFIEGLVTPDGEPIGEDVAFCRRVSQLGIPIHVHTGVRCGHVKQYVLDEAYYLAARQARQAAEEAVNEDRLAATAEAQGKRKSPEERRAAARAALQEGPEQGPELDSDAVLAGALG